MRTIFLLLSLAVLIQACGGRANDKKPMPDANAIPVKLLPINAQTNAGAIHVAGLVATENEARLSFKIGGIIDNIYVKEGEKVKKGQLLATLKSTEIAAQVQQVQLSLEKAERDYRRLSNLYQDSVATLEQLQNAKTGVDIAKQNLQQVAFNQQYAKIYAPSDGFIVRKAGNAGELASAGSPVLLMNAVSGSSKWILKAGVADKEWSAIETGNTATVQFDAFPGKTFPAVVSKKALAADPVSGSFELQLQIDFGKEQPAAGMFGSASITPARQTTGYSIPYEALLEANGKKGFVFVSDDRKTVKKVEVTISGISNNVAYIQDGLQGHSFIVTAGSPYLNDNSIIKVIE
ncbi:MAG TPA: efflux RND transporter periplasmic adaptor subunit [Chitinophagaceae bacterium]|nr:efflux RND transporter periplasmic adaptor subunit [Chitinophagaceae bacterium]